MNASYVRAPSASHLFKTDKRISRSPNMTKYFISSCKEKITAQTPNTEGWLSILRLLKIDITDYDKSRILLGHLKSYGDVVVKLGSSPDIAREYTYSRKLYKTKGFVKYICSFECNDNFRSITEPTSHICNGVGTQMQVILMPYFSLGSLASYPWNSDNLPILHSCLKQTVLSIITAFHTLNFIHGDLHSGNVLLKKSENTHIHYTFNDVVLSIPTYGIRTWIMDFENSSIAEMNSQYNTIMALNNFYFDIEKFFTLLKISINNIDIRSIVPIKQFINNLLCKSINMEPNDISQMINLIDGITLL